MAAAAPRRGYALVVALILVAMVSLAATIVLASRSADALREKERELLWVGGQYREALRSYVDATPAGHAQRFPRSLADLVADNRGPITKRHLRRIYPDPMTGLADWELEGSPGVITGLHSASQDLPLQRAGFGPGEEEFARATSYAEWRFFYAPPAGGLAAAGADSGSGAPRPPQQAPPPEPFIVPAAMPPSQPQPPGGSPAYEPTNDPRQIAQGICYDQYVLPSRFCTENPPPQGTSVVSCLRAYKQQYNACMASVGG